MPAHSNPNENPPIPENRSNTFMVHPFNLNPLIRVFGSRTSNDSTTCRALRTAQLDAAYNQRERKRQGAQPHRVAIASQYD